MAFGQSEGHQFFNSWALWQKMCFVLACGIVVTIFIGALKLWYERNKIKKYTKQDKGKQVQTPEMLEAQPVTPTSSNDTKDDTKDEIPFGIRAIQSGIEIDGVWISRSNTPAASSRGSIMSDHKPPRSHAGSHLERPQAAVLGSSRNSSRAPSSSFDRAVSAERVAIDSRSSSPGRARNSAAPVRCSNCLHHIPQESRSAGPSGPPSPRNESTTESHANSHKSSRRTSDESDYMAIHNDARAYESAYLRPASLQANVDPRTDLDLLQSHRMSHVAETGQLTPRVRRPGYSGEWASVADQQMKTVNGVDYFMPRKTPSPPMVSVGEGVVSPPDVTPTQDGHTSNQAKQGVPLLESYAPKAAYYPDTYEPRGPQHQFSYDEVPYEVTTEQNQREDRVLRTVNSGFQVLKPGTFAPPTPEEMALAERRQSKKLQKRRRSSESRQSAFVEGLSPS